MKKGVLIFLSILVILVVGGFIYFSIQLNDLNEKYEKSIIEKETQVEQVKNDIGPEITTDYSTIIEDLLKSDIVKDLPKDTALKVKFYNFDNGERQWENSYILKTNSVKLGSEESDMDIIIASEYVENLKSDDVCTVLSLAGEENQFYVESELSDTALAWKFKSMLEYKDCLGL